MAENLLHDVRKKLANARTACPNMHEEIYLLADYMSTVANDQLVPTGMAVCLTMVIEDLKRGKSGFAVSENEELPEYLIKNKAQILVQAMMFPQIIDAIADEAFAEEFRAILKEVYKWDIPKKVTPSDDNFDFPPYVKATVDWWANAICNPKFDNGDDSEAGGMASFLAMLLGNSGEQLSQDSISAFKKHLGESLIKEFEYRDSIDLSVDYAPCSTLASAAEKAGVDTNKFPWKTFMCISKTEVSVRAGYGAKFEKIWTA